MHAKNTTSSGQKTTTQTKEQAIDFGSLTFCSEPLVPLPGDPWPTFDVVEAFTYENDPHLAPTVVTRNPTPVTNATPAKLPTPSPQKSRRRAEPLDQQSPPTTQKKSPRSSVALAKSGAKRIPRPRNAFMIYRSTAWAQQKIPTGIERDHRHISRIIGHCWNSLPEEEKQIWRTKAEEEKQEHLKKYPGYRYSPINRTSKPIKRNVNRNGEKDKQRCKKVAELLLSGAEGSALENAVKDLDASNEGCSSISAQDSPTPILSQGPVTPLFSSKPLYRDEAQHSSKFFSPQNISHELPMFSLSMLTPPEDILPLPITPASSGDSSQSQYLPYQYDQSYPGMPAYLVSPETTPISLGGGEDPYSPAISWGDYPSGIHTPHNDIYYA